MTSDAAAIPVRKGLRKLGLAKPTMAVGIACTVCSGGPILTGPFASPMEIGSPSLRPRLPVFTLE
ncbi:hypothetical protein SAMN04490239_9261 [Rhodococcus koreensis]|uniref:Uncharacterized protein n=1 Tax=Rhodococcus koreensis TaxID=99653 RepID=A0A1H5ELP6_9NOCA|nr:hypothetical protein SAMN04490239_9261 [Rhodococcus koreensis]